MMIDVRRKVSRPAHLIDACMRGPLPLQKRYDVLLDGKPLEQCFMADEEMGLAEVYDFNADGTFGALENGSLASRLRVGRVQFRERRP